MKILITGGAGFIGSAFVRRALADRDGNEVVTLDKITYAGDPANLAELEAEPRHRFVEGDIIDAALVESLMPGVAAIVNIAAETHVDRSLLEPAAFVRTNIEGTLTLLEAARRHGVRLLQVGTDEVYGDMPGDERATEQAPLRPRSPYAASKAAADHLVGAFVVSHGVDAVITRGCNTIGPRQYPEKLVPLFVARALRDEQLPLYGDGRQVRDWLAVEDHVEGIWLALTQGRPGGVYNLGREQERENVAVVADILRRLDKPASLVRQVADRPGHDRRYAIDARLAREELGWRPQFSATEALERAVDWCATHAQWSRDRLDGATGQSYAERQYAWRLAAGRKDQG